MKKTIHIDVTKGELSKFIDNLKSWTNEAPKVRKQIVSDLKREGMNEIGKSMAASNYDSEERTKTIITNPNDGNGIIGITGSQALYDEFGTGTIGEQNPHENKGSFNLNPYNSGKTIRQNKSSNSNATNAGIPVNGLYWTYKYQGTKIYTQGRPAGMHVYKASKKIKHKMKAITEKRIKEWLSKL